MKVLNFEDSVYKANAIRKILGNRCGVASVEQVSNVEDGLKMLKDAENAGEPFDHGTTCQFWKRSPASSPYRSSSFQKCSGLF